MLVTQMLAPSKATPWGVLPVEMVPRLTPSLARIYRATGQDVPVGKRTLELNPNHPLITGLQQAHKDRGDDPTNGETAELLYGAALLAEGNAPEDPARFAELLTHRLARTV